MATREVSAKPAGVAGTGQLCNGSAMAAFLAAGIGAFALGLIVVIHEVGLFSAPTLYQPAGGVSGRTTLAIVVWLFTWGALHARWKDRDIAPGPVVFVTLILVTIGVLGTFPPVWTALSQG
jgi:hypothetical protein